MTAQKRYTLIVYNAISARTWGITMVIITIIVMAITMGTVHNIILSQMARGTCQKSCVTSAETKDTTPINAQKRRMGHQIHSRDNLRGLKII